MGRKTKKSDESDGGGEVGCELASQASNNSAHGEVGNQALSLSDIQKLLTGMEERIIGSLTAQITSNHAAIIRHDETIQAIVTGDKTAHRGPFIACLHHFQMKQRIIKLAREKGPLMYRGAEIHIYADYSAEVATKRAAFTPIKSSLRNAGLAYSPSSPLNSGAVNLLQTRCVGLADLYKERLRLQTEHNLLTTDEATRLILKSRHNVYEFGDKANKLLALQARQTAAARRLILLKWKQHSPPSFSQWVKDVMYFLQLEKLSSYSGAPLTPLLEHGNPFWTSMTPYKIHLIKNKVGSSGEQ
ncbi:hypothetical protein F7725_019053 [Dissostichus mawsoni]|uniref:Uncharacterized protein n=1 Tax=Dissostichus mawsoni TaxID=36200 RepID=A0A7J5XT97_DISMA|nr:hypothetical protein F7725_019053 [Dissostichus mawsoni]